MPIVRIPAQEIAVRDCDQASKVACEIRDLLKKAVVYYLSGTCSRVGVMAPWFFLSSRNEPRFYRSLQKLGMTALNQEQKFSVDYRSVRDVITTKTFLLSDAVADKAPHTVAEFMRLRNELVDLISLRHPEVDLTPQVVTAVVDYAVETYGRHPTVVEGGYVGFQEMFGHLCGCDNSHCARALVGAYE